MPLQGLEIPQLLRGEKQKQLRAAKKRMMSARGGNQALLAALALLVRDGTQTREVTPKREMRGYRKQLSGCDSEDESLTMRTRRILLELLLRHKPRYAPL